MYKIRLQSFQIAPGRIGNGMAVFVIVAGNPVFHIRFLGKRYATGLSKFETQWGTFSDPWIHQPQPKCGFVILGEEGTISSYDYEPTIFVQTRDCPEGKPMPVDELLPPYQDPVQNFVHSLSTGEPVHAPLSPAICRIGQQIVDSAILSAQEKRTVPLVA